MPLSTLSLLARLEQSRVLDPLALQELKQYYPAEAFFTARSLADELVKQGYLTEFQATALMSDPPQPLVLGKYVLTSELRHSGKGKVFCAWHPRLKRQVALKTFPNVRIDAGQESNPFLRAAELVGRLDHEHIVATYDADEADGIPFVVTQYIDGVTLDRLVRRRGPLTVQDSVALILQAARGLAFAHQRDVIHGDIKPSNLILGADGVLRILNLGLPGIATETPAGVQSDLAGLGDTLWFLLTGRPLDTGRPDTENRPDAHDQPPRRLIDVRSDVPEALEAAFEKMVTKDPGEHYQTADELIAAIENCGAGPLPPRAHLSRLVVSDRTSRPRRRPETASRAANSPTHPRSVPSSLSRLNWAAVIAAGVALGAAVVTATLKRIRQTRPRR